MPLSPWFHPNSELECQANWEESWLFSESTSANSDTPSSEATVVGFSAVWVIWFFKLVLNCLIRETALSYSDFTAAPLTYSQHQFSLEPLHVCACICSKRAVHPSGGHLETHIASGPVCLYFVRAKACTQSKLGAYHSNTVLGISWS